MESRYNISPLDPKNNVEWGQILLETYCIIKGKKIELSEPDTSQFIESLYYPYKCRLNEKNQVMINNYYTGLTIEEVSESCERIIFKPDFNTIDSDLMWKECAANLGKNLNKPANNY